MRRRILIGVVGCTAIAGGAWWMLTPAALGDRIVLQPDNRTVVAQGREIYGDACASCHGAQLEGQPNWKTRGPNGTLPAPPHDPSGHTWHHPDQVLFALTKYGPGVATGNPGYVSNMPAYSDVLSDDEIIAVLSYIKSTWPAEIRARHDDINARAGAS
jgi:mono/diheme cytochrome c family protein